MKNAARRLVPVLLAAAFMTTLLLCCIALFATVPAWFASLRDECRLVTASTLDARQRPARDGSLTLESWACPEVEHFADALRPAAQRAGFMGFRLAYVSGGESASTLEGSRILMAALFPAAFCTPVPLHLLEIGLKDAGDPRLAVLGKDIGNTEVFLVDGLDAAELSALLQLQPQPHGADRLVHLRTIAMRKHFVVSASMLLRARDGAAAQRDLAALLP
ncbi:MAG: hypothetical protein EXS14_07095 [Planctomycetes bacterium]|nr:hypothetical protein [Planctomycetota bacterium]